MNSGILFKGNRIDNGEPVEGYLVICNGRLNNGEYYIIPSVDGVEFYRGGKYSLYGFVKVDQLTVERILNHA